MSAEAKCRPLEAPVNGDLKCSTKNATTVCQVECRAGHSLLLKGHETPVPSADRAAYCQWHDGLWVMGRHKTPLMQLECELDPPTPKFEAQLKLRVAVVAPCRDEAAVEGVKEALKAALIQRNAEVCREANCSQLDATCHDNDTSVDNVRLAAYLDVVWTVSADYTPIEDYYYEGVDVPEGESLIEKIQVPQSAASSVHPFIDPSLTGGDGEHHPGRPGLPPADPPLWRPHPAAFVLRGQVGLGLPPTRLRRQRGHQQVQSVELIFH